MGLRINEINNNESYEIKPYTSSKNENSNASENNFASYGVVYEHNTDKTLESCVYTKEQVMAARSSVENKQFQNNLKILGFYSGSVATDGNLGSQESLRAIKNFQRVYGLQISGGSNDQTRAKLNEVIAFYNSTLADPELSTVAKTVSGYSDYNESLVKADVARSWTFLRVGMGLTAKQASGVMGNIMQESGASPTNAQDSKMNSSKLRDTGYTYSTTDNVAYGIVQWKNQSRKQGLKDMTDTMGSTVSNCNVQFAYLRSELETSCKSAWNKIKDKDDVENAARVFCGEFEVTAWSDQRLDKANTVYNALA